MTGTGNRRISAKVTLDPDGGGAVSVVLIEADGKRTPLSIPPLTHPDAIEGFIYALAAQHKVPPGAVEITMERGRPPNQVVHPASPTRH